MQFPTVTRKLRAVSPSGRLPKRRTVAAAGTTAVVAALVAVAGVEAATGSGSAAASGGHAPGFKVSAAQPDRQLSTHSGLTTHTAAPDGAQHRTDFTAAVHPHKAKSAHKAAP